LKRRTRGGGKTCEGGDLGVKWRERVHHKKNRESERERVK